MENASKALLIAAAVLIVILIIAFGMKIFNSTGDTSADAVEVGEAMASKSTSATLQLMQGNNKSKEDVLKVLEYVDNLDSKNITVHLYYGKNNYVTGSTSTIRNSGYFNPGKFQVKIVEKGNSLTITIKYMNLV